VVRKTPTSLGHGPGSRPAAPAKEPEIDRSRLDTPTLLRNFTIGRGQKPESSEGRKLLACDAAYLSVAESGFSCCQQKKKNKKTKKKKKTKNIKQKHKNKTQTTQTHTNTEKTHNNTLCIQARGKQSLTNKKRTLFLNDDSQRDYRD